MERVNNSERVSKQEIKPGRLGGRREQPGGLWVFDVGLEATRSESRLASARHGHFEQRLT